MKTMKHILPRLALLSVAVLLAAACHKSTGEGANVALKRQFDAWRAIHYPAAVEKDGIYILEDTPGNGPAWNKNLGITFMTYTMRDLDGNVSYNTDEQWAKQLGKWNQTYYYGPQVVPTGKDATYAGLDILLDGMREGGVRTAIIPSWMMTYNRYDSLDKYLETSTDTPSMIYTVTFLGQTDNLKEYEYRLMKEYATENWEVSDTLGTAAVFFKSFSHFDEEPVEMPNDTTVYINYTGRLLNGRAFDTTVADTAKVWGLYSSSKTYAQQQVKWFSSDQDYTSITLGEDETSVIPGFAYGLSVMHPGEAGKCFFVSKYGYSGSGSGNSIPSFSPLCFELELTEKP
jgi:FKBP-type peptidyl-prolyl cis-trans isomerase 2